MTGVPPTAATAAGAAAGVGGGDGVGGADAQEDKPVQVS